MSNKYWTQCGSFSFSLDGASSSNFKSYFYRLIMWWINTDDNRSNQNNYEYMKPITQSVRYSFQILTKFEIIKNIGKTPHFKISLKSIDSRANGRPGRHQGRISYSYVHCSHIFILTVSKKWYLLETSAWVQANRYNGNLSLSSCMTLQE